MHTTTIRRSLAALALTAVSATAVADSWMPPTPERFVDADGNYHVIVQPGGTFTYARRGPDNEPVEPLQDQDAGWKDDATIPVRDGDVVIARGELPHRPMLVAVSNTGRGFVALDRYAQLGYGKIAIVVNGEGRITHEKTLEQLFPGEVDEFTHSVSSIWWRRGAWLDEDAGAAVIVAAGNRVRVLEMATGEIRSGENDDIVRGIASASTSGRNLSLELAREREIGGIEPTLRDLLRRPGVARSTRLRAAVVLAERGDESGHVDVISAAESPRPDSVSAEDHKYAIAHLPTVLGDLAFPLLRDIMRGPAGDGWHPAQQAFVSMGEASVPTLLEMLAATEESPDHRGGAAHALREIGSQKALDGLLAAVGDENGYTANAAANAAIAIAGDDCAPALLAHLENGCTQDGRIAMFFEEVKYRQAVPALIALLERADPEDFDFRRAIDALEFQSGQAFGDDAAAWRRWWAQSQR